MLLIQNAGVCTQQVHIAPLITKGRGSTDAGIFSKIFNGFLTPCFYLTDVTLQERQKPVIKHKQKIGFLE